MPAVPGFKMRPGSIKRVKLTNFMCHSELAVDFGTQISFVTGHNGSGKSAILAGIVAGLGARANVTSRGGKLSDLIKHGENSSLDFSFFRTATVIISLHNAGSDPAPYLSNIYGSTIVVERIFHVEKSASYFLKSASGKVISKKRQDLDLILNHFEIQVNNPVFLMNQDTCRSFLNSKTGKELYSFFYKAPLLDEMEEMVEMTRRQAAEALVVVHQKEEEMKPITAAIEMWKEKQEKCVRPKNLQKDISELKTNIEIKNCHALKGSLDNVKRTLLEAEEKLTEHQRHITRCEEKIPSLQQRLQEEREKADSLRPGMEESQKALDDSKPEMILIREAAQNAQRAMMDCQNELKEKRRNLESLQKQLDAAQNQEDLREYDEKKIELEREMEEAKTLIQECQINRRSAETERKRLEAEMAECRRHLEPVQHSWTAVQRAMEELDREISRYQGSQGSSSAVSRLGKDAILKKEIIDSLVERKALKGAIIGPCVDQMSLKEQPYGTAVERAVGAWFRTYLLEDEIDRQTIMDEFKRRNVAPPILDCALGSGQKFPTTEMAFHDKCNAPFPTVGDLLTFKHPYVRTVLLDALNLHQIIVLPTMEQARKHYRDETPYQNCRHILDLQANQHSSDADGYQFIPGRSQNVSVLAANFDAQIDAKKLERADKAAVLESKRDEKTNLEKEISLLQQKMSFKQRDVIKFQDLENKTQNKFNNMKNELEAMKSSQPTDIQVLLDEVEELKRVVEGVSEENVRLKEVFLKTKTKETKAEERLKIMKEQAQDEVKELDQVMADIEIIERNLAEKEAEIKDSKKTLTALEKTLALRTAECAAARTAFEESKAAMLASGVPLDKLKLRVKKTVEEMEEIIFQLEFRLKKLKVDFENSWEFCQEKLDELIDSKKSVEAQIVSAKNLVTLMSKNAVLRGENYVTSREKASAVLSACFKGMLEERGYEGGVSFDHDEKNLEFKVNPHKNSQQEDSNVKSLSGGERSFTMVCFLVALWQLIDIPFRVLDEFDVFMDMVNRDFAMTRLVQAAVESGRQFIFLTPLHFSQGILDDFKVSSSVEVIRMPTARHTLPTAERAE